MLDFLRDPVWQLVIGIIAIIIAMFSLPSRRKKSLAYAILTQTKLVQVEKEVEQKVTVFYEGNPVQNLHLVMLELANDGNISIPVSDFERPLSFFFGDNAFIIDSKVSLVEPKNLKPLLKVDKNKITIKPLLLNSRDRIQITVLLSEFDGNIQSDGRIEGVKEVKAGINLPAPMSQRILTLLFIVIVAGIIWAMFNHLKDILTFVVYVVIITCALIIFFPATLEKWFKWRKH